MNNLMELKTYQRTVRLNANLINKTVIVCYSYSLREKKIVNHLIC